MTRKLTIIVALLACVFAAPADAHLVKLPDHPKKSVLENRLAQQTENVKHLRYVARHGKANVRRWHRHMLPIVLAERRETRIALRPLEGRALAHHLAIGRGWSTDALDEIVGHESGWNPCRHYPQTTNCGYTGINACGIPQANPCPHAWRGNLWGTRIAQVYWLIDYIARRYGDVWGALSHKRSTGWY